MSVILSEAKNLALLVFEQGQILRCAQDDNYRLIARGTCEN